jgi:hypothetical protein
MVAEIVRKKLEGRLDSDEERHHRVCRVVVPVAIAV